MPSLSPIKFVKKLFGDQRFRYLVGGGWNTVFGYAIFWLLNETLGKALHYEILIVLSNLLSILSAYLVHKYFVFRKHGHFFTDLARFSTVYLGMMLGNMAVAPLFIEVMKMKVMASQAIIITITIVVGYILNKNFSFRRKAEAAESENKAAGTNG